MRFLRYVAAITLALATGLGLAPAQAIVAVAPAAAPGSAGLIGLSFDDGPDPIATPLVLDILKAKHARATFFLLGEKVAKYPAIVRRMKAEGHVIGNHSWNHPNFQNISAAEAERQILRTNAAIKKVTGVKPILFRYPFGIESDAGNVIIRREGMWGGVLWSWPTNLRGDFECPGVQGVVNYGLGNAVAQGILLLHDGAEIVRSCGVEQFEYLGLLIHKLRLKGYKFGVIEIAWGPSAVNGNSWVKVIP